MPIMQHFALPSYIYTAVLPSLQELCAAEDPSKVPELAALLQRNIRMSKDRYYTTQLGEKASEVLGSGTEVFPLVHGGLARSSPAMVEIFYSNTKCLRPSHGGYGSCLQPGHRFYEVRRMVIGARLCAGAFFGLSDAA
jgi:hypothetical protein